MSSKIKTITGFTALVLFLYVVTPGVWGQAKNTPPRVKSAALDDFTFINTSSVVIVTNNAQITSGATIIVTIQPESACSECPKTKLANVKLGLLAHPQDFQTFTREGRYLIPFYMKGKLAKVNNKWTVTVSKNHYRKIFSIDQNGRLEKGTLIRSIENHACPRPHVLIQTFPRKPRHFNAEELHITGIFYQSPGSKLIKKISAGAIVQNKGTIWFKIRLGQEGGYLLALLKSNKEVSNIFPGTRKALERGEYHIPYHLDNPTTDFLETAAKNAIEAKLEPGEIMIGGYTFDNQKGSEIFSFFYTHNPNPRLVEYMKGAKEIGKDMPRKKGVLQGAVRFNPNAVIAKPTFRRGKINLKFVHK